MYKKKDMNIKSYEGQDAFYSGTDEEYEEFLKNSEVDVNEGSEAEPVANTQRINLNETINIQNVIDKFKKTAGDIGSGAKSLKDTVVNKMDIFKVKKETDKADETDKDVTDDDNDEETMTDKIKFSVKSSAQKIDEIKEDVEAISKMPKRVDDFDLKLQLVGNSMTQLSDKINALSEKLSNIENQMNDDKKNTEQNYSEIKEAVSAVNTGVNDIKMTVNSVAKVNDSIFDLKNTQLNTKNAVSDLETAFARLKKKCVLGVTVLSILSAIVIILEIVLMLS